MTFPDPIHKNYFHLVVTVEDCLTVLLNLLKNNPSNQSYFREGSYIRRLVDFFELSSIGEKRWSAQKVTNVHLLLQVIFKRILFSNSSLSVIDHSNISLANELNTEYRFLSTYS